MLDLKNLTTPQLYAIKSILENGVTAVAEKEYAGKNSALCNKSPPAGYPTDKTEYGDPQCYRYPLNTKERCLAAWRYVHQAGNKSILGDKFSSIEGKIKSYAKKKYNLDLQSGASEVVDWMTTMLDFYDSETSGEGYSSSSQEVVMEEKDIKALQDSLAAKETELVSTKTKLSASETKLSEMEKSIGELSTKVAQLETLTKELNDAKAELTALRQFKADTEAAAKKATDIKAVSEKLAGAGFTSVDVAAEADYWLSMSETNLATTIAKMTEIKNTANPNSKEPVKVPVLTGDHKSEAVSVLEAGLKERKNRGK
jgi:phage shock protein A